MKAADVKKGDHVIWRGQEMIVLDPEPFWAIGKVTKVLHRSNTRTNCVLLGDTGLTRKTVASLGSIRPITAADLVVAEGALRDAEMRARWVLRPVETAFELLLQGRTDEAVVLAEKWRHARRTAEAVVESRRAEVERLKAGGMDDVS